MRFLRLIATCDPRSGGPISGLLSSATALEALGHETHLATLDDPRAPWVSDFPFVVHALGPAVRVYGYTPRLYPWLVKHLPRYDNVIVHGLWNYISLGSWRALRKTNTPYFVFAHGSLDPWHRKFYPVKDAVKQIFWSAAEGRILRDAAAVLFTSDEERTLAHRAYKGFSDYRAEVVSYGCADPPGDPGRQVAAFREFCGLRPHDRYLLFLSRLHPKKGVPELIDAFHASAPPDVHLVIAGPDQVGLATTLQARAAELGLASRVHWPGMLSGDLKWGGFRGADAFVLPSHGENFGIVVAEALSCSAPALITRQVNIWREVVSSGSGFASDDSTSFELALRSFFALSEFDRTRMREKARACFLSHFEIQRAATDLVRLGQALQGEEQRPGDGEKSLSRALI